MKEEFQEGINNLMSLLMTSKLRLQAVVGVFSIGRHRKHLVT